MATAFLTELLITKYNKVTKFLQIAIGVTKHDKISTNYDRTGWKRK